MIKIICDFCKAEVSPQALQASVVLMRERTNPNNLQQKFPTKRDFHACPECIQLVENQLVEMVTGGKIVK